MVIVAIAPTLDRFAEIAAACGAPNTLTDIDTSLTDPTAIATQAQALLVVLDALPEGTIPPGCAADLGAIAEAIIAETPPISCDATIPAADVPALISAITAANGAGSPQTICLEEGTYALTGVQHNADGPNGLPAISGDVTLLGLGSGAVIQRDSSAPQFRILRVTSAGRLVLEKITIRGGDPGGSHNGGGIRNLGTLELKNSIVEENVARDGAGIRNNGTLIATESTIRNNTSPTSGAGLFSNTGSSTTLVETAVVANVASASSGLGGGIFMNGALLQITGGVLEANNARNGGGLFVSTASTPVLLNGVQIVRNGASNAGGGLYIHSGQVELEAVTVAENIAIKLGGGIRNGDQLTMRASQIVENVGRDGGGGVFNGGTLVLEDSSLSGNSTDATLASGGGIMNQGVLSMNGGTVTENVARNGGGLFGNGGQAALTGVEIAQNEAQNNGGGIFDTSSATVVLSGVTLLNNSATSLGGGLASDGSFSITGSTLANNSAGAMGGGIFTGASQSNEVLQSCISGNSAPLTSGVRNNNAGVQLYATGNWWGAGDGPSGAGPGSGDAVSAGVDFSGYVADCATALSLAGAATAGLELQGLSGVAGELTLELAEAGLALGVEEAGAGTGLLYADTFETADGWWSRGAWSVDLRGGYAGGGWVVDGTLRGVESVLEQRQWVAVPGSGKVVLRFWQRGELSTADEVWVEVRAAGTESWSLLAALSGTDAEWSEYEIGLEAWAGYLVQLRWRVVTAGEMGAEGLEADAGAEPLAGSYWLDEVRIEQP